jgi:hypothetical protein
MPKKISKLTMRVTLFLIVTAGVLAILFLSYPDKVVFILELFSAFVLAGGGEWVLRKLCDWVEKKMEKKNPLLD